MGQGCMDTGTYKGRVSRGNSKFQAPNSKQIQMANIQMTERVRWEEKIVGRGEADRVRGSERAG